MTDANEMWKINERKKREYVEESMRALREPTRREMRSTRDEKFTEYFFGSAYSRAEIETNYRIAMLQKEGKWDDVLAQAQTDYDQWSQRGTQYESAEDLATRRVALEAALSYQEDYETELEIIDSLHLTAMKRAFRETGLFDRMKEVGSDEKYFGIDELEPRLSPVLSCFSGSSAFYVGGVQPYGRQFRVEGLSQGHSESGLVSEDQAIMAATAMQQNSGAAYVMAETSNGPSNKLPRSGRKPQTIICTIKDDEDPVVNSYEIDTNLRAFFRAKVRELQFNHVAQMYDI